MSSLSLIAKLLEEAGEHGVGWFRNLKNRQNVQLPLESIGPHGDHDGYIMMGDPRIVEGLGIDRDTARVIQLAGYGAKKEELTPDELRGLSKYLGKDDFLTATENPSRNGPNPADVRKAFDEIYPNSRARESYYHPIEAFPDVARLRLYKSRHGGKNVLTSESGAKPVTALEDLRRFLDEYEATGSDIDKIFVEAADLDAATTVNDVYSHSAGALKRLLEIK